jgi:type IX secretion system PorP/SprF family membrane protein
MTKKVVILTMILMYSMLGYIKAQQTPLYTQYMMNGFLINPGVTGSEGYTSMNLTSREQWVGMDGAPQTNSFSAQTRIAKNSVFSRFRKNAKSRYKRNSGIGKVGFGMQVLNDRNGIVDRTGGEMCYAYHLYMRQAQLSFGMGLSGYQFKIDWAQLRAQQNESVSNDPMTQTADMLNMFRLNARVGVWYSSPTLYGGISASDLFQSYLTFSSDGKDKYKQRRCYYITGGYKGEINRDYMIEPSTLIKISEAGGATQFDIGARLYYKEDYWFGLAYRSGGSDGTIAVTANSAVCIMAGVRVDRLFFGYAYDYNFSALSPLTYGSHEFMLALKLGDNTRRYRWLNRY